MTLTQESATPGPAVVTSGEPPLRARRRIRSKRAWRGSVGVIVLLVIWELASRAGVVDPLLVPAPSTLVEHLIWLAGPDAVPAFALWMNIGWSVARLIAGVVIGCIVGVPLGFVMGTSRWFKLSFRPLLTIVLAIPSLALAPILILFLGLNNSVAITVIAIEATVLMAYNAELGASSVPRHMKWALASMGAGQLTTFRQVVLPASLPALVTALKLSVGYGWRALIAVESLAATSYGLGYMIFQAQSYMNTETIFAGILAIAIVGFTLERVVFGRLERRINAWYAIQTKER